MSDADFQIYANYFAFIIPVFSGIIGVFFLIPKFNPKRQYEDLKMSPISKQAIRLYIQGIIAFIVGFGLVFGLLYLIMPWLNKIGLI